MSTLTDTVGIMTVAIWILAFIWYFRRRSTGNQSIRLVVAVIVLVGVGILMTVTLVSMLQVSGSLTK